MILPAITRCRLTSWLMMTAAVVFLSIQNVVAQYPTPIDQTTLGISQQLLNSPEVGNLEGIQRFGQPLRTDPDPGIGYTNRVFPTVGKGGMDEESFLWALAHAPEVFQLKSKYHELGGHLATRERQISAGQSVEQTERAIENTQLEIARLQLLLQLALGSKRSSNFVSRYATARNTTQGFRSNVLSNYRDGSLANYSADALGNTTSLGNVTTFGTGVSGTLFSGDVPPTVPLFQQPLIQIKVRLVEATRLNSSDFRSVLDYISQTGTPSRFVVGNNINGNNQSTRAATRLPVGTGVLAENQPTPPDIGKLSAISGSGAMVNLTTERLNIITNMLVTQFNSDLFTVPEVVTLNGQNVEFVAGDKRPFPLGLTHVQAVGETKQEFFYKHVGTLLQITPRIVNWGKHLEGGGESPIVAQEINNWNRLALWMNDDGNLLVEPDLKQLVERFASPNLLPVPSEMKKAMLVELEKYPASELRERLYKFDAVFDPNQTKVDDATRESAELPPPVHSAEPLNGESINPPDQGGPILRQPFGCACDWKPEDCSIDLEILVRESNVNTDGTVENENSIANVVQVKSGHGVVMGGLIGTSEIESVSKIPVLGDAPVVGYFFRSKSTDRAKTELIIIVEASVLPNSSRASDETARDFQLGYGYVSGELRDNPLQVGMYRAGFGEYLPPASIHEDEFWLKHGNKMRRVATEIDDIFR